MKNIDLSKVFYKTKALLEAQGQWPGEGHPAPVDYAIADQYLIQEEPANYELTFQVDFGGSEGIYIDLWLELWEKGSNESVKRSFGTIKTLAQTKNDLASYAALAAHFVCIARDELYKFLKQTFTCAFVSYTVYSMEMDPHALHAPSMDIEKIRNDTADYAGEYRQVSGGYFPTRISSCGQICKYLINKFMVEGAYMLSATDVLVVKLVHADGTDISSGSYIMDLNDQLLPIHFPGSV